jgi:ferredoxin-NADP reductase
MISAPRLGAVLTGALVGSGRGFPPEAFQSTHEALCIASGTGIAPFLALAESGSAMNDTHLFYSLRGSEFQLLEHMLDQKLLHMSKWKSVNVHITAGTDDNMYVGGKSSKWWENKLAKLVAETGPTFKFHCGRMSLDTIKESLTLDGKHVLFCGSKSLEWQVKMWFLNSMKVFTTGYD